MSRIVRVTPLRDYRLSVEFQDGVSGVVDLSDDLDGEIFEPLRNEAMFQQVSVDEFGAIAWPNGADISPDALYSEIIGRARRPQETLKAEPGSNG